MIIREGFIITNHKNNDGPLFVAPHAFPAFHKPDYYQDQGTHYISNMLANMNKGKALISTITREKDIGIDFFRQPPSIEQAIKNYEHFITYHKSKKLWTKKTFYYRKKYAWVARDEAHHEEKKNIYNMFWKEIRESNNPVFFIHRQFLNPKNHPSVIDVIPFNNVTKTRKVVGEVNKKYSHMLEKIVPIYTEAFYFKTHCLQLKVNLENETRFVFFDHMKPKLRDRVEKFEKKIKKHPQLKITVMKNFNGDVVRPVISEILKEKDIPILHIEISEFLCKNLPDLAVYIISDIAKAFK